MTLTGKGTGGTTGGSASASPSTISWVSVAVGKGGAPKAATLTNGGTAAISIGSVTLTGANPGDYQISAKTCGASLAAAASCTATVVFSPTANGLRTATLNFNDSATNTPQTVSLSGTGTGGTSGFSISPLNPSVAENGSIQFTSSATATWTASCGTIGSTTGLYKAPATTGSCTVTATGSAGTASTMVTVTGSTGSVTVTPATVAMHAIGQTQFTASQAVTWSASCGAITTAGLYTAPAAPGSCTITAAATANKANTGSATATVTLVNYLTRKGTVSGTGVQSGEFVLTPATIASGKFGQRWSVGLDGSIWGQPLYVNAITAGGKLRNVVYVTTNNDSVYAFDADTGTELWKTNFLSAGVTAVTGASTKISTQTGILGTPAIDIDEQAIYVVAETAENNATEFRHRLHALNLVTGKEMFGGPVLISNPDLPPLYKFQRPGLLIANSNVYVGFGSIEDRAPYHGLLIAFDEKTLAQTAVFNPTPTGSEGGIWMSGASPAADSNGDIYVSIGNGTVSTNNYGESVVRLSPSLQVLDYFTPYNWSTLDAGDYDVGSGSVIVVPDQTGPYPHELIACGKPTPIYVMNRDNMGKLEASSDNIVQLLDHQLGNTGAFRDSGQPCYNSPAMWEQNVYFAANHDVLKMFTLDSNTGKLSTTPVSKGTYTYLWPGSDPVVSSNGSSNGIVWTLDSATSTLHASDATDVSKTLYTSPALGSAVRWVPPTVANGHVYMGVGNKIVAYGLAP